MARKDKQEWLAPPCCLGLKPLAVASKTDKKGRWIWEQVPQKKKDKELRREYNRRLAKADAKGKTFIKWPPHEE